MLPGSVLATSFLVFNPFHVHVNNKQNGCFQKDTCEECMGGAPRDDLLASITLNNAFCYNRGQNGLAPMPR